MGLCQVHAKRQNAASKKRAEAPHELMHVTSGSTDYHLQSRSQRPVIAFGSSGLTSRLCRLIASRDDRLCLTSLDDWNLPKQHTLNEDARHLFRVAERGMSMHGSRATSRRSLVCDLRCPDDCRAKTPPVRVSIQSPFVTAGPKRMNRKTASE